MTGLVLEGGAMRGLFTAGVLDVLAEHGIRFDGIIGTSAGAAFGCNYKSRQPGRVLRYNTRYCRCWRYAGVRSLLLTGDIYGARFCYEDIPLRLDPFDSDAFAADPTEFWVTATDMDTGEAVYHRCTDGRQTDLEWIRASASMPMVSRPVVLEGCRLSDGGTADSIPLQKLEELGFRRNLVILTQPADYVKQPNALLPLMRISLHRYPRLVEALAHRHEMYNAQLALVRRREAEGSVLVLRPPQALTIRAVCHDPDELRRVYEIGSRLALDMLPQIDTFLSQSVH